MTDAPHDPYACLTAADQLALCRRFNIPTPTPDVPFARCVEKADRDQLAMNATIMYDALATTTDVRLMIAAHALRCGVRVLPPDPQLAPAKLPPLRHAPPRTERGQTAMHGSRAGRAAEPPKTSRARVVETHVLIRLAPNPRKKNTETHARYECYALGCTPAELVTRGVRRGDIIWDLNHGYVEFGAPASADTTDEAAQATPQQPASNAVTEQSNGE